MFLLKRQAFLLLLISIILLVSIPPRLWQLNKYPKTIVDEAAYIRDINNIISSRKINLNKQQWDGSQATLAYYPTILLSSIGIKNKLFALRLISVLFSLASLIPFFAIVKKYSNNLIAFCTTILFSYSYYFLEFSRVGWGTIYPITLGLYLMWILQSALEKFSYWKFFIAGLIWGLIFYLYRGGEIYMIAALLFLCVKLINAKPYLKKKMIIASIFICTGLVVTIPWLVTITHKWNFYNERSSVVSIFQTSLPYHGFRNTFAILRYQTLTTIASWIFFLPVPGGGVENQRYLPLIFPPINPGLIPLVWIGIIIAVKDVGKTFHWLVIFILGLIFGQILTVNPPNGARALVFLPVIYIFISFALYYLCKRFKNKILANPVFILTTAVFACIDFLFYQFWMTWIRVWL